MAGCGGNVSELLLLLVYFLKVVVHVSKLFSGGLSTACV
jgi:hypothetical protein